MSSLHSLSAVLAVSFGVLPSCGGDATGSDPSPTSNGGGSSGGTPGGSGGTPGGSGGTLGGSGGTGGSASATVCADPPPAQGSRCDLSAADNSVTPLLAHCSWGDDPRPSCRTTALCSGERWQVTEPDEEVCKQPALGADCGESPPQASSECADAQSACWYPSGERCWCSPCRGGSEYPLCQTITPPEWACASPAPGCPAKMPQAGSACDRAGLSCGPNCELEIICENGFWRWRSGVCPICAAPDTPIATPEGERSLASIQVGDLVYSVDHNAIVAVPVLKVAHTEVAAHQVVRVVLDSGAVLEISAGHPTASGETFGQLRPGSALDPQHVVVSAELVPYTHSATYDLLPASDTGSYFAAGANVGSSLHR